MKQRNPAVIFIFFTLLLDVIGFGIIIPVMPALITELTNEPLSKASVYSGWLMFAFAVMQFIFSPIMGGLSDKFGRRPILLFSLFGFALDYLLLALAPNLFWLFVGRIIAGITGASFTTATAYIADVSEPEKRTQNFGLVGAAFGIGFIIGPVLGGLLGQFGTRLPFYGAAILTIMNLLYGYFILPESLSKNNRRNFDWKRANPIGSLLHFKKYPVLAGLILSLIFIYLAAHAVQSTWTFYTIELFNWSETTIGISLGVVGVLVAFVQGFLIRYTTPYFGQKKSVFIGLAFYTLGLTLFGFASTSWMMFLYLVPYCLGGIAGPALQGIISNQVDANQQGELQGALASLMSLTSIIGPPLMTNLFAMSIKPNASFYLPGIPFFTGAIFMLVSLFLAWKTLRSHQLK